MLLTGNSTKTGLRAAALLVAGSICCGSVFAQSGQPAPSSEKMLLQPGTPAAGQPMIYAIDHPQSNQPLPVPGSLGIAVGRRLELQVAVPATPGAPVAQTQGIWRPVDSLSLRAGYQQTDGSRMLLCAEADNCAPAVSANASESSLQAYALGASWQVSRALNLNVDYFSSDSQLPTNITPVWFSTAGSGLNLGSTEAVDISLTCDISAGNWGDLELGLQVSRLADFEYSLGAAQTETPLNAAAFGLGWQKGTFRGDLTSRYLDVVNGSEQTAGWTSFDVSFAWRTPWNASLSVGARNVLNNPAPASNGLSDAELENFFGRVPYVRYRQDL